MTTTGPVQLEPPFRPFFILPELLSPEHHEDEGRRHTPVSWLFAAIARLVRPEPVPSPVFVPYEEQEPFPALADDALVTFALSVPPDASTDAACMGQLVSALAAARFPLSFELIGSGGRVTLQLACGASDAEHVRATIEGVLPDVALTEDDDRLAVLWDEDADHCMIDCGLAEEFFLPLPLREHFPVDPYATLIPALAAAGRGEFLVLQVLITPTLNPWRDAIRDALDDGDGGCFIADAPWFLAAAKEKTRTRLFATALRLGAQGERPAALLARTEPYLTQYAREDRNSLVPLARDAPPSCLLSRTTCRTGMILSAEELVGLVHVPDQSVRHPALVRALLRSLPLPVDAMGRDLILGTHRYRGVVSPVGIDHESRFGHVWALGGTGCGKSTLLAGMALQDIAAGYGVAVLDPHGDLVDDIMARIPDAARERVILFDPADTAYPVGFNILSARTEIERNLLSSDLVAIIRRYATSWGDTMSSVLGEAVLALLTHPKGGTLVELRQFLRDEQFRAAYLAGVPDAEVRRFWREDYPLIGSKSIGSLLSRLDSFLRPRIVRNIVGQQNAALDLCRVMDGGGVFLAKLGKGLIGEENAGLLGSLLVAKFHQLALARQEQAKEERRPFFCYADEFQHFVTPSMESLATEGRKYRFGLTLAHQMRAQLADVPRIEGALLGNCHTRIVFRVGEGDAKALAQGFGFFEAGDILRLGRGEAIARIGGAANDCMLRTAPLDAVDDDEAAERRADIVARTRERYAVPPREEAAMPDTVPAPTVPQTMAPATPPLLELAPPPPVSVPPAPPRRPRPPPTTSGRGGAAHKYLQQLVKRLAEERGWKATVEGAAGDGQADVLLERDGLRVGCEISITTTAVHEEGNLAKCLAAGCSRVFFVSPEKAQRAKVTKRIKEAMPGAPIDVLAPEGIVAALDALGVAQPTETVVRGYKVKVSRKECSPEEDARRRKAIAGVIAKGLGR
jgi:hypothetical protein